MVVDGRSTARLLLDDLVRIRVLPVCAPPVLLSNMLLYLGDVNNLGDISMTLSPLASEFGSGMVSLSGVFVVDRRRSWLEFSRCAKMLSIWRRVDVERLFVCVCVLYVCVYM